MLVDYTETLQILGQWVGACASARGLQQIRFPHFKQDNRNLSSKKAEQCAEETSFEEWFKSQEEGKNKSGSESILAPVCYSVCC